MGRDHPYHFSNPFPLISMVDVGDLLIRRGSLEYFSDERGMGFSSSPLGSAVPVAAICFAIVLGPHIPTYGKFTMPWLYSCFSHFSGLQSHGYTVILCYTHKSSLWPAPPGTFVPSKRSISHCRIRTQRNCWAAKGNTAGPVQDQPAERDQKILGPK